MRWVQVAQSSARREIVAEDFVVVKCYSRNQNSRAIKIFGERQTLGSRRQTPDATVHRKRIAVTLKANERQTPDVGVQRKRIL